MEFDTITAISTPLGEGGIAIIRVSGPQSIKAVDKIFKGRHSLSTVDSHTIHYGHLVDKENNVIEEVMVSVMRAPRTFTREDVVEINCHGGIVSVNRVLDLVLEQNVRLAEPGEFTKRAFLNGRIDLSQAEAVIDLIRAKTDRAMKVAVGQVQGKLSQLIKQLRHQLVELMAHIEVTIDYPEHDVDELTRGLLSEKSRWVQSEIQKLLQTAAQGKILREGLSTVIVGRPNVGKSSLLNSLLQEAKAIVTDIPGTTRDIIEEYVNIRGIPLRLVDTAGIRETEDIVEKIGVEKSREMLGKADLILLLLNYGEELTEEDRELLGLVNQMNAIIIINKTDLPQKINMEEVKGLVSELPLVTMSVKQEEGIDQLEEAIARMFFSGQIQNDDLTYVSNARHIQLLKEASAAIGEAYEAVESGLPVDMVAFDIRRSWELLGEVVGDTVSEDLIDQIFSQFCLGK
ncbi:tRNA uridine-5-carboxymethylaminomethyl(34) synthesis GTPase MnmE [Aneurinibacillus sp. Ricciae_BoGa-3]|uniref:tRNA uridine-5-carboxymethylaminomethyl(34) synthesis GTPase MnmE n=1 Tax=Aneurinibacillus sp. Ricciae_BoGa-3 TaxID=3022697 RepID=UPI00233FEE67|nr:tRNA uridine-5-carboxymethylaminomethyl(34) synthesis GTPase MnmE [Aneurinibacillus sp. Ricciae_BoGa-3]WCK54521.1 tRNA uridine-5-carboxymethylaminomethyl(34) synthesis GTPase MnmE [Aneurinibacillus sp. Ricciae_BoGa-3]